MKNTKLKNYWNSFYKNDSISNPSTFAKFVNKKLQNKKGRILDIGCGNGRDAFFFNKKGFDVMGIDISLKIIKKNSKYKAKNLLFKEFDIGKNKLKYKFDIIYCRFFVHTLDLKLENKLIDLILSIKKKNTKVFFEFRNLKDRIFKPFKNKAHNTMVEYEKGHYRRIIDPNIFKKKFITLTGSKIIYQKSSINLSIVKKDNPNLTRMIYKF